MPHYRVTRPEGYKPGTPGHTDKSARQGYYTDAGDEEEARRIIRERVKHDFPSVVNERLDVQLWR